MRVWVCVCILFCSAFSQEGLETTTIVANVTEAKSFYWVVSYLSQMSISLPFYFFFFLARCNVICLALQYNTIHYCYKVHFNCKWTRTLYFNSVQQFELSVCKTLPWKNVDEIFHSNLNGLQNWWRKVKKWNCSDIHRIEWRINEYVKCPLFTQFFCCQALTSKRQINID